jgi:hypothetical protein
MNMSDEWIRYAVTYAIILATPIFLAIRLAKKGFFTPINLERGFLLTSFVLFFITIVFNLAYTGIMGWNLKAASSLESWLDVLTESMGITSFAMYFREYRRVVKIMKLEAEQKCPQKTEEI